MHAIQQFLIFIGGTIFFNLKAWLTQSHGAIMQFTVKKHKHTVFNISSHESDMQLLLNAQQHENINHKN